MPETCRLWSYCRQLQQDRETLQHKMAQDEDVKNRELAARKVVQQILAEQYKGDIEKKQREKKEADERSRHTDTMCVQKVVQETDPKNIIETFKNTQNTASDAGLRWRQKGHGDLNFDARMVTLNQQSQPNLVRDNFVRGQQRKQETLKYYEEMKLDGKRDREEKEYKKAHELDWGKRFVANDQNIFQINQARSQALREEQKRKYAEELREQYRHDQEIKRNVHRMTLTEKRLNYDNLQV